MGEDFRELKREARAQLHDYMSVPALCFMDKADPNPIPVTVRVHEKWTTLGDLKGTSFNYAEVESITPRLIFWRTQITLKRKMFISVEAGVAFQIDTILPPDDQTVTATCSKLAVDQTAGFPVPVTA